MTIIKTVFNKKDNNSFYKEDTFVSYNSNKLGNHINVYNGFHNGSKGRPIIILEFNNLFIICVHLDHRLQENLYKTNVFESILTNNVITNNVTIKKKLSDLIINKNVILCGDFNTHNSQINEVVENINKNINNKISGQNNERITYLSNNNSMYFDHIITSLPQSNYLDIYNENTFTSFIKPNNDISIKDFIKINKTEMSDHLQVIKFLLYDKV